MANISTHFIWQLSSILDENSKHQKTSGLKNDVTCVNIRFGAEKEKTRGLLLMYEKNKKIHWEKWNIKK